MLRVPAVIILIAWLAGCQSPEVTPKRTGHEFVPARVGAFWEYAVTETTISQVNGQTNVLSELRLDVTDSIVAMGQTTYILQRRTRLQGETVWNAAETWSMRLDGFQCVIQQGNIPFVKLRFPLSEGKAWNGNALNAIGGTDQCSDGSFMCDNYQATNLAQPFELPGVLLYNDTVTIVENNEDDPIVMKDFRQAIHAKDVGLVYREDIHLEYCTVGPCIGQQVVENGTIVRQTLTAYGFE